MWAICKSFLLVAMVPKNSCAADVTLRPISSGSKVVPSKILQQASLFHLLRKNGRACLRCISGVDTMISVESDCNFFLFEEIILCGYPYEGTWSTICRGVFFSPWVFKGVCVFDMEQKKKKTHMFQ